MSNLKELYRQRINAAVDISNYLSDSNITLDANNLRYDEDNFMEAMAAFLNAINVYINAMFDLRVNMQEAGLVKKHVLNNINTISGCLLALGKGLTDDKYIDMMKRMVMDMDPDDILE